MKTVTALKKKVKPQEASNPNTPCIDLHYLGGGSDKVYHAAIRHSGDETYTVHFAFGRRGSSLAFGAKTQTPVPLDQAIAIYDKLVAEKIAKGYRESPGISGEVFGPSILSPQGERTEVRGGPLTVAIPRKESSGVVPQLCNDCTEEEAEALIKDPAWGAQEKLDGRRRIVRVSGGNVQGINKLGQVVPLLPEISRAVGMFGSSALLDGEEIGNALHVFGLLELDGNDLRGFSYLDSYHALDILIRRFPSPALSLVELAVTTKEKRALIKRLRAGNKEGIVFKRLAAAWSPGRPASGGDHIKFKFWADASVIVLARNAKRSVQIGVLPVPGGVPMPIGNVSVPGKYELPDVGDIIDVRYLYANRGGALYQPQYRGRRDDVARDECLETRIKYKGGK